MLRVTQEVVEVRRWAESRGARPCREEATGRIWLVYAGEACTAREVGWDEFEATFKVGRSVFVYDDAPAGRRFFVGDEGAARAFVGEAERAHGGLALA
jgi:hypothetical protein